MIRKYKKITVLILLRLSYEVLFDLERVFARKDIDVLPNLHQNNVHTDDSPPIYSKGQIEDRIRVPIIKRPLFTV